MIQLLIVKTGSTYPEIADQHGDFHHWFERIVDRPGVGISVCDVAGGEALPAYSDQDAVIVTGSPAMVTDRAPWSEAAADWLRTWVGLEKPVLGVCYGHQLLAHALGGRVGYHPGGREMGTLEVTLSDCVKGDPLFADQPDRFHVHLSHLQTVLELPPGAQLLASSSHEPHQAYRVGACAWGVQFHPEFDEPIMRAYLQRLKTRLGEEGLDATAMIAQLQPTQAAQEVLHRFMDWVCRYSSRAADGTA